MKGSRADHKPARLNGRSKRRIYGDVRKHYLDSFSPAHFLCDLFASFGQSLFTRHNPMHYQLSLVAYQEWPNWQSDTKNWRPQFCRPLLTYLWVWILLFEKRGRMDIDVEKLRKESNELKSGLGSVAWATLEMFKRGGMPDIEIIELKEKMNIYFAKPSNDECNSILKVVESRLVEDKEPGRDTWY
jgi:hypothetical protein